MRGLLEVVRTQREPRDVLDPADSLERRGREVPLREVVRHVHRQADSVVPGLPQPTLEHRTEARRNPDLAEDPRLDARELRAGRAHARAHRTRVRRRHGDALDTDDERDAKTVDDLLQPGRDTLPAQVRLGAVEDEEGRPLGVPCDVDDEPRRRVRRPAVLVVVHERAPPPVVVELVCVEGHEPLRLERVDEVVRDELGGPARVDEAFERVQKDRPGATLVRAETRRDALVDLVQVRRVEHRSSFVRPGPV